MSAHHFEIGSLRIEPYKHSIVEYKGRFVGRVSRVVDGVCHIVLDPTENHSELEGISELIQSDSRVEIDLLSARPPKRTWEPNENLADKNSPSFQTDDELEETEV